MPQPFSLNAWQLRISFLRIALHLFPALPLILALLLTMLLPRGTARAQGFGLHSAIARPIQTQTHEKAAIITIHGHIDAIMAESITRRVNLAEKANCTLIIFDINSTGGLLGPALQISRFIRTIPLATVAYVHSQAIAAAALIAISARQMVMSPHAMIGDGQPFEIHGLTATDISAATTGHNPSDVLKSLLHSAMKNGYNPLLLMGMLSPRLQIDEVRNHITQKTAIVTAQHRRILVHRVKHLPGGVSVHPWAYVREIKKKGSLLTLGSRQAQHLSLSQATITGHDELRATLNIVGPHVILLRLDVMERFSRWLADPWVRFVLFLLVLVCGYVALAHAGSLIPGSIAVMALLLLVGAPYLTGLAQWWEILLIVAGVAIIIADLHFLGGIGLLAVPGFILMAVGLIASFIPTQPHHAGFPLISQTFSAFQTGMAVVVFGTALAIGILMLLIRYLQLAPGLRKLQLQLPIVTPLPSAAAAPAGENLFESADTLFVGALGKAVTELRPAGKARFDDRLVNVVAEGTYIPEGAAVQVLQISENQVVVKELPVK